MPTRSKVKHEPREISDRISPLEVGIDEISVDQIQEVPIAKLAEVKKTPDEIKESAARYIAYALVAGFLLFLGWPFYYLSTAPKPTMNATSVVVNQTIDLIKTVSAVLSGLVGSVVMYYFGVEKKKNQ